MGRPLQGKASSPFFSVIAGRVEGGYCLSVFGQVGGRERERERVKKQIQKPYSPAAHPR